MHGHGHGALMVINVPLVSSIHDIHTPLLNVANSLRFNLSTKVSKKSISSQSFILDAQLEIQTLNGLNLQCGPSMTS